MKPRLPSFWGRGFLFFKVCSKVGAGPRPARSSSVVFRSGGPCGRPFVLRETIGERWEFRLRAGRGVGMFRPRASSSQSPLCSGHPSMGIRHDAPLLLLSPPDPLRWAPAGAPIFCADRKLPKSCQRGEGFRVPYPFCPFGTFPPDRGNRPLPLDTPSP